MNGSEVIGFDDTYNSWRLAFDAFQFVFSCAIALFAWLVSRQKAASDKVEGLEHRLARVEARLEYTPTTEALHEVALSNERVVGELKKTTERLEGLGEIVKRLDRITERQEVYLLNSKGTV